MNKKDQKIKPCKKVSIGGQAVIEGVMMRGSSSMATAVRDADGIIRLETKRIKPQKERNIFFRLPIIRGVVAFVSSMIGGTSVLLRSAEVYGEGEPSKFEKWMSEKLKINVMSVIGGLSLVFGLALAVILFMWLPQLLRTFLEYLFSTQFNLWAKNFIEGGFKLLIFVSYILLSSALNDVKRTFMYHGAEHKTISCYEKGLDLTVENAKKCSRVHDRCGTTFMVFVLLISILVFAFVESLIGNEVEKLSRILLKIALLPIVAGLSYELLKGLSKTNCFIFYPLKLPGLLLQRITTREPDDAMLEVAIKAFTTVTMMDADPSIPEREFVLPKKRSELLVEVKNKLSEHGIFESAESEWILSLTLKLKRDELITDDLVSPLMIDKINDIVEQRITGKPLWYCIGDTEFYGYKIKVDGRVLIPRPETELLVYNALKIIDESSDVLDLCTGSGAIAIAVKKEKYAKVTAVDKSIDALTIAKENASINSAEIEFIESDMFNALSGRKFDVIISNPPYIKTDEITSLQKEVKDFEPIMALDGGVTGLEFYKIISNNAIDYLKSDGVLLLECGIGQAQEIAEMLKGFSSVEIIKDYENIDRIVKAVL